MLFRLFTSFSSFSHSFQARQKSRKEVASQRVILFKRKRNNIIDSWSLTDESSGQYEVRPLPFIFLPGSSYVECTYGVDLSLRFVSSSSSPLRGVYLRLMMLSAHARQLLFSLESSTQTFFFLYHR